MIKIRYFGTVIFFLFYVLISTSGDDDSHISCEVYINFKKIKKYALCGIEKLVWH